MIAFECPSCGCKAFKQPCFNCGMLMVEYDAGPSKSTEGCPALIADGMESHFDYAIGREVDSKSERKRVYEEMGVNLTSAKEWRRKYGDGDYTTPGKAVGFPGQTHRKSTAQRKIRQYT